MNKAKYFGIARLLLAWIYLWSFLDKMFGLGYNTTLKNSWYTGGSPTKDYLLHGTSGPLQGFYESLAGMPWIDSVFMVGLLLIGLALLTGIGTKIANWSGIVLMFLFWSSTFPPKYNPFLSYHLIYAFIHFGLLKFESSWMSLSMYWRELDVVKNNPWLE